MVRLTFANECACCNNGEPDPQTIDDTTQQRNDLMTE